MTINSTSQTTDTREFQIPLLKDQHTHPLFYSSCMDGLDLRDIDSKKEALDAIGSKATSNQEILIVRGWVDSNYKLTDEDLEQFPPVVVFNLSLHSLKRNTGATALLKNLYGTDVDNWSIPKWYEKHIRVVLNCIAKLNASVERLQRFYASLKETYGVAYAEEMLLVDAEELDLFETAGLLDRTRFWAAPDTYKGLSASARDMVHGLKLFSDGALGVRTAAVHSPYDTGDHGFMTYSDDELHAILEDCFSTGKAIAVHAIGDKAIDQVVNSFSKQQDKMNDTTEVRIEHAQLISRETAARAKELGIKLCMQPNFSADSADYSDRLAQDYLEANNPFRMLIDDVGYLPGQDLIFGSDGMPHGVAEALKQSLFPPYPQQRLTLNEFVAGYCMTDQSDEWINVSISDDDVTLDLSTSQRQPIGSERIRVVAAEDRFVRVAGSWLYSRVRALQGSRPPIVFLHGIGESSQSFREMFHQPQLLAHDLIAIDQAGYGRSSEAEDSQYSFDIQIERILAVLAQLGVQNFHLVGHSMGGDIATKMCLQDPQARILSLMNVEGDLTRKDMFISGPAKKAMDGGNFDAWFSKTFRETTVFEKMAPKRASQARYYASLQFARSAAFQQNAKEIYDTHFAAEPSGFAENYLRVECSKCFLWGRHSLHQEGQNFLRDHKLQNTRFEDSGHWLMIDEANRFASILADFVSGKPLSANE